MLSDKTIERVRLQVNIRDVVSNYTSLQQSGSRFKCCCPLHNEKTPSFFIDPNRNTWHCFGACGEGGDAIAFIQKKEGLNFISAVRHLASKYHIPIEDDTCERTPEEIEQEKQREAMLIAYNNIQRYYVANIHNHDEQARAAYEYACKRWGSEFVEESGIGFAYDSWDGLFRYADRAGISPSLLKDMGLLGLSKDNTRLYDFFRGRIMIPICDRYARIIGYTARSLSSEENSPKYLNTSNNLLYQKSNTIFGFHQAVASATKEDKFYLVEGAPDVLRLQSIGIDNVVAPLGSDWTDNQLEQLKRYVTTLCFLPDADRINLAEHYGTGIKKVMQIGRKAMEKGFKVMVREIPIGADGQKNDPDSFCKSQAIFCDLQEEDFITWYAGKRVLDAGEAEPSIAIIEDIANVVALCDKEHERNLYVDKLLRLIPGRGTWNKTIREAVKSRTAATLKIISNPTNQDLLERYGFQQIGNRYVSLNADGKMTYWSNFVLRPLFHIKDTLNAVRIFELTNTAGHKETIELKQEDLTSIQRFSQRVEGLGNYIWMAPSNRLTQLKTYLYENTETATRIDQLGWQSAGFYAFGNGIFADGTWYPVDEYGIVRLSEHGNQYLPSSSLIYKKDTQLYQFERRFVHHNWSGITLRDYVSLMTAVFGDNGKVAFAFLLASLFRDVITSHTKSFPILNIFGPKGSGKSELGHSLMAFFIIENTPPNIQNSTLPALADAVAQCANALVHIDEFKNTIDIDKREFLKGLWDGTGRNRMNIDKDKKREVTRVDSGIILTGQEMATADIALFSRFIFLRYNKTEFTVEQKEKYQRLKDTRKLGCSHLTLEILKHRTLMENSFTKSYEQVKQDMLSRLNGTIVEDRIFFNWLIPLAAFYCLRDRLDIQFSYTDLMEICAKGMIEQNGESKHNNEISTFWDIVNYLRQEGQVVREADYRLGCEKTLKVDNSPNLQEFNTPKKILYLRYKRIFELYQIHGKKIGEVLLPKSSLAYYLENSPAYLGKKRSFRFKNIIQGHTMGSVVKDFNGYEHFKEETMLDQCYCFDYEKIVELFGVNLDVEFDY